MGGRAVGLCLLHAQEEVHFSCWSRKFIKSDSCKGTCSEELFDDVLSFLALKLLSLKI